MKKSLQVDKRVTWAVIKELMKNLIKEETMFCWIDGKFYRIDRKK